MDQGPKPVLVQVQIRLVLAVLEPMPLQDRARDHLGHPEDGLSTRRHRVAQAEVKEKVAGVLVALPGGQVNRDHCLDSREVRLPMGLLAPLPPLVDQTTFVGAISLV